MMDVPPRWLGLLGAALATAFIARLFLAHWDQLPEPMATHWPLSGPPDGAMPRRFIAVGSISIPWTLALAALAVSTQRARATLTTITFMLGATFATLSWSLVTLNQGAAHWRNAAPIPWYHLVVITVVSVAPGLLAARLFRSVGGRKDSSTALPALELASGQRAVWLGSARNRWLWSLCVLPLLAVVFTSGSVSGMALTSSVTAVATLLLADAFSVVYVTADRHGVRVRCGHLGLLRRSVALAEIARAEAFELAPMAHGGWGYRGSLWLMNRAAIVVRRGTALRITLQNGKELCVTVDNADDGAALINGMINHSRVV